QIGAHIRVNREPAVDGKALLYDSGVLLTRKRLSGGDSAKSDLQGRNRQDEQAAHVKRSSLRREPTQRWTRRFHRDDHNAPATPRPCGTRRHCVPQELGHFFTMAAAPSSISAIELPRVLERRWWCVVF